MRLSFLFNKNYFLLGVLIILGFSAYVFIVSDSFKTMDDEYSIVNNEDIRDFANAGKILTSSFFGDQSYYRPLVYLTYMLEYHYFHLDPRGYYATNLWLHLAAAVLVFYLIGLLCKERLAAFLTALLFALHPVHWEAVSNIPGRAILLCGFFYILAFLFFCLSQNSPRRGVSAGFFTASLFSFLLSLLSKESAVSFPVLISAHLFFNKAQPLKKIFPTVVPFLAVLFFYFLFRKHLGITHVFPWQNPQDAVLGFLTFLRSVITHLRLFIAPFDLHFDRSRALFTKFTDVQLILTVLFFASVSLTLYRLKLKIPPLALFFLAWFFIDLLPVSQLIATVGVQPGYIAASEHFLYTASIGIFALMVLAGRSLFQIGLKRRVLSQESALLAVSGIYIFFLLTTIQQNIYSSQEISMFQQTLRVDPHNTRIRNSLGLAFAKKGLFKQAKEQFQRVVDQDPVNVMAGISLGKALCDLNQYLEGLREYERVARIMTPMPVKSARLVKLLEENTRLTEDILIKKYEERIRKEPENAQWYYSLGVVYSKKGDMQNSLEQYQKAVLLDQGNRPALFNLAVSYDALEQWGDAIHYYRHFLKLDAPSDDLNKIAADNLERIYQRIK